MKSRVHLSAIRYSLSNSQLTAEEISERMKRDGTGDLTAQQISTFLLSRDGHYQRVVHYDYETRRFNVLSQFKWGEETAIVTGRMLLAVLGAIQIKNPLRKNLYAELHATVEALVSIALCPNMQEANLGDVWFSPRHPTTPEDAKAIGAFKGVYQIIRTNFIFDLAADPALARQFLELLQVARDQA